MNKMRNKEPMSGDTPTPVPKRVPKLCGADIELGNFVLGLESHGDTCYEASRALLREIDGLPRGRQNQTAFNFYGGGYYGTTAWGNNAQDWGRKFLATNGGCVYIDLDHLELCIPEVVSAFDHVACWHAMLRIARQALVAANEKLPAGQKIKVLVNNSDGRSNSYGSHIDIMITERERKNIFDRKLHHMLFLAAYQASSIIFTGQGKVGAENGRPHAPYQISQRADFDEMLTGIQTTWRRPIVNSRNESLAIDGVARLHIIFYDNTLCHVASFLKIGVMQIVLAMLEAGHVNPNLILDDPVRAVTLWSHDPTLKTGARMASGAKLTAVELQLLFLEEGRRFVEAGGCDGIVPHADSILSLWEDILLKLKIGDLPALVPRIDWILKLHILERAMEQRSDLTWDSSEIKHLDHIYSSLDLSEGLYWAYERAGAVERVVSEEQIERFMHKPPEDTRAWTRAMLLRVAESDDVADVDWDTIRIREEKGRFWSPQRVLDLSNPLGFTRADTEHIIQESSTFGDVLDALEALEPYGNAEGIIPARLNTGSYQAPLATYPAALAGSVESRDGTGSGGKWGENQAK